MHCVCTIVVLETYLLVVAPSGTPATPESGRLVVLQRSTAVSIEKRLKD